MLKISTYEIQEKSMDIFLRSIENKIGTVKYNEHMLKSSMHIRSVLQTLIDREHDKFRMIENVFCGKKKVPYQNVMNTVYLKGGIIVDWITLPFTSMHVRDLDYSVSIETRDRINSGENQSKICSRIEFELHWLLDQLPSESDILDSLFEGYEEMEIYNAYNESKSSLTLKRSNVKLSLPRRFVSYYSTSLNETTDLYRYYYSMFLKVDGKNKHELKLGIVDLSIDITNKAKYKSNLIKRYLDKTTYVITQSTLALLNDQLVSLLFSAVTLNVKYEKRKQRVYNLLLELENSEIRASSITLHESRQLKEAKAPFDVIYFCRYLCSNGVNLKDWIVRVVEDKNLDKKESQERVCEMMREVLPKVIRKFKVNK
jgi:hypothetical protein